MPRFVREQSIEHAIGPRGRFMLRATDPDVRLRAVPGDMARVQVRFEISSDSDSGADQAFERVRYQVLAHEGALEVVEPRLSGQVAGSIARIFGIGSPRVATSVVVELPVDAEVNIDGVSADVEVTGTRGSQEYRSVSGALRLTDIGGDLRVRGVSADVSLRAAAAVRLELNTVSGDVSAMAPRFSALRIVTVSGDVELEGALPTDAESRLETVSGDVRVGVVNGLTIEVRALSSDVEVSVPHRSEGSRDRRRYVIGDGRARLVFRSMSGDLVAHAPRRLSPAAAAPAVPDDQLTILRALERGEIDVDEAARRLTGGPSSA